MAEPRAVRRSTSFANSPRSVTTVKSPAFSIAWATAPAATTHGRRRASPMFAITTDFRAVIQRLMDKRKLPATQPVKYAPWIIERADLARPDVQKEVAAVHRGGRRPLTLRDQRELPLD